MTHRILIVFHDEKAVALGSQALEHLEQLIVVTWVQPDTRFIKHIKHALEPRPHGACEPDTLRLTARKRRSLAADIQIAKPNRLQESKAPTDFLEHFATDALFLRRKL